MNKEWAEKIRVSNIKTWEDKSIRSDHSKRMKAIHESGGWHLTESGYKKRCTKTKQELERMAKLSKTSQPKAAAKIKGSNQFGIMKRGRLDHANCKAWAIRSPAGTAYKFTNLNEWARQNEHIIDDPNPESITTTHRRFVLGIIGLGGKRGNACSHWGWTLISKDELNDLLSRNIYVNEQ